MENGVPLTYKNVAVSYDQAYLGLTTSLQQFFVTVKLRARLKVQALAGFGMQYGVAACHLTYQGSVRDQAFRTDRGM